MKVREKKRKIDNEDRVQKERLQLHSVPQNNNNKGICGLQNPMSCSLSEVLTLLRRF